jgi:hypothetical protein
MRIRAAFRYFGPDHLERAAQHVGLIFVGDHQHGVVDAAQRRDFVGEPCW